MIYRLETLPAQLLVLSLSGNPPVLDRLPHPVATARKRATSSEHDIEDHRTKFLRRQVKTLPSRTRLHLPF